MDILKRSFYFALFAVLFIACNHPNTPMERAAFKLKEKGFISEIQYLQLQPYSGDSAWYKQLVLELCYKSLLEKYNLGPFDNFSLAVDESVSESDLAKLNEQTIARVDELNTTGILTKKEYDYLIALVHQKPMHPDMLWAELLSFYQVAKLNAPERLLELCKELFDLHLLNEEEYSLLNQKINTAEIASAFEVITALPNALALDASELNANTNEELFVNYLYMINRHYHIGDIGNAEGNVVALPKDAGYDYQEHEAHVSLTCDGTKYRHKEYYVKDAQTYEGLYKIYNGILADQLSTSRLYLLEDRSGPYSRPHGFPKALLMLTEKQGKALFTSVATKFGMSLSSEEYNTLSRKEVGHQLERLKGIGLFAHLANETTDSIINSALEQNLTLSKALEEFPNLTSQFDVELGNIDNPYETLLEEFARISKGKFNPTDIKDGFDIEKGGQFEVSFKWLGETHKTKLTVTGDWVYVNFYPFVNNLLSTKTDGYKFHYSTYEYYIMLNDEQYKLLEEMGLFDWDVY